MVFLSRMLSLSSSLESIEAKTLGINQSHGWGRRDGRCKEGGELDGATKAVDGGSGVVEQAYLPYVIGA